MGSNAPSFYNTYHFLSLSFPQQLSIPFKVPRPSFLPLLSVLAPTFFRSLPHAQLSLLSNPLHLLISPAETAATSSIVLRLPAVSSVASHLWNFCILTTFQSSCAPVDLPSATLLFIYGTILSRDDQQDAYQSVDRPSRGPGLAATCSCLAP